MSVVYSHSCPFIISRKSPFIAEELNIISGSGYTVANTNAGREWAKLGCTGATIPMQNGGGHWDENCLGIEVMTPVRVFPFGAPLSAITIGAFEDMGYSVDYGLADTFTINDLGPSCGNSCPVAPTGGRNLGYSGPSEEERIAYINDVKDDLVYFHGTSRKSVVSHCNAVC